MFNLLNPILPPFSMALFRFLWFFFMYHGLHNYISRYEAEAANLHVCELIKKYCAKHKGGLEYIE